MKLILSAKEITYEDDVTITVKGRSVTVEGPRGKLSDDFHHVDIAITHDAASVRCAGFDKHIASALTLCTTCRPGRPAVRAHADNRPLARTEPARTAAHHHLPLPPTHPYPSAR